MGSEDFGQERKNESWLQSNDSASCLIVANYLICIECGRGGGRDGRGMRVFVRFSSGANCQSFRGKQGLDPPSPVVQSEFVDDLFEDGAIQEICDCQIAVDRA